MPTRKIRNLEKCNPWKKISACTHPEHNIPNMRVFEPGEYEHECPACGNITPFFVNPPYAWSKLAKNNFSQSY